MVDPATLNSDFVQSCDSCVLASYGIASSHYTDNDIQNFFNNYCKSKNITPEPFPEKAYDDHFQELWKNNPISGCEIVLELHQNSNEKSFLSSRDSFNVKLIKSIANEQDSIANELVDNDSLLLGTFDVDTGTHSAIFGFGGDKWFYVETRIGVPKNGIIQIESLGEMGELHDGIMFTEKSFK